MSGIWELSPQSEPLLQQLLQTVQSQNEDNKWARVFGRKRKVLTNSGQNEDIENKICKIEPIQVASKPAKEEIEPELLPKIDNEFIDLLEYETNSRFENLVEESLKCPQILSGVADKLSTNAIEKLTNQIYGQTDLNQTFIDIFHEKFFPTYLKRECNWLTFDMLMKSNKIYPIQFRKLIKIVLKTTEVPYKILQDYSQTLDEELKENMLNTIAEVELDTNQFVNNLFTIFSLYKDCKRTDYIQNFVLRNLIQHSKDCANDKSFGRLLLTFLQAQKIMQPISDIKKLENVIESHRSPFKKPCVAVFREILEKLQ